MVLMHVRGYYAVQAHTARRAELSSAKQAHQLHLSELKRQRETTAETLTCR